MLSFGRIGRVFLARAPQDMRLARVEPLAWLAQVTPVLVQHRRGRQVDLDSLIPTGIPTV